MADTLKLGLVGADAAGQGWGPVAHLPAIRALEEIELAALCTSRPESAAAAGKAYGIDRAYHDINELVAQPDIDIISAVIRIPNHYEVVMAALHAGKHVYCEWPLGVNLAETAAMAALAREKGVVAAVGLQGRHDATLTHMKELYEAGWLGELLSVKLTMLLTGSAEHPSRAAYEQNVRKAVRLLTIVGGHTLDYIAYCFGAVTEVSARVATRVKHLRMMDTDEMVDTEFEDNMLLHGVLKGGALLSYQVSTVPFNAHGWQLEAYGSKGTLIATTPGLPQITPVRLTGSQGGEALAELSIPARLQVVPDSVPMGPARNVGQQYVRMAEAIREGSPFSPNFDDALQVYRLVDAIQRSSDEGRVVAL